MGEVSSSNDPFRLPDSGCCFLILTDYTDTTTIIALDHKRIQLR